MTTEPVLPQSARTLQEGDDTFFSLDDVVAVWRQLSRRSAHNSVKYYSNSSNSRQEEASALFTQKRFKSASSPGNGFYYSQVHAVEKYFSQMKPPERSLYPSVSAAVEVILALRTQVASSFATQVTTSTPTPFHTIVQVQHTQTNIAQSVAFSSASSSSSSSSAPQSLVLSLNRHLEETKTMEESHSVFVNSRVRTAEASFSHTSIETHTVKRQKRVTMEEQMVCEFSERDAADEIRDRFCEFICDHSSGSDQVQRYYRHLPSDMQDFVDTSEPLGPLQPSRNDYIQYLQATWAIEDLGPKGFATSPLFKTKPTTLLLTLPPSPRPPPLSEEEEQKDKGDHSGEDLMSDNDDHDDDDDYEELSDDDFDVHSAPPDLGEFEEPTYFIRPRAHSI